MRLLVTGGCGFIGSHYVRYALDAGHNVVNLDALTYSGNPANLADVQNHPGYRFVHGDVCTAAIVEPLVHEANAVVHIAAESHVDRSIDDAASFVRTNVLGTQVLLDALRRDPAGRDKPCVAVSTDEVFGDLPFDRPDQKFNEHSPYAPSSPYAASKAAADHLALAYHRTFGLDVRITHGTNTLGPNQHPEKLVPRFVINLLRGEKVPLYGDGQNVRDWVHVADHCAGIHAVLTRGRPGERYGIGAENERSNLELTRALLELLDLDDAMIQRVPDRPGHDRRYAMNAQKSREQLGWQPAHSAWPGALAETVEWYRRNETWWRQSVVR